MTGIALTCQHAVCNVMAMERAISSQRNAGNSGVKIAALLFALQHWWGGHRYPINFDKSPRKDWETEVICWTIVTIIWPPTHTHILHLSNCGASTKICPHRNELGNQTVNCRGIAPIICQNLIVPVLLDWHWARNGTRRSKGVRAHLLRQRETLGTISWIYSCLVLERLWIIIELFGIVQLLELLLGCTQDFLLDYWIIRLLELLDYGKDFG